MTVKLYAKNDQQQYPDLFSHLSNIVWACWHIWHISWNLDWNFQIRTSRQPHVAVARWDGIYHGMCRVIALYCQKTKNTDVRPVLNLKKPVGTICFVNFYSYLGKMGPLWSISFKGVETDNLEIFCHPSHTLPFWRWVLPNLERELRRR